MLDRPGPGGSYSDTGDTLLDLGAVIASGWADPETFPPEEYARAAAFYASLRPHDERLLGIREAVAAEIQAWTGRAPRDVGSFGLGLNLATSDLDLGIGYPPEGRERIMRALGPHAVFKGERRTSFTTTRLVFLLVRGGVEVDVSVLTEEDFRVACRMLDEIDQTMSTPERVAHTWVKSLLRRAGRREDYAAWKLVTYRRFCPEFNTLWRGVPAVQGSGGIAPLSLPDPLSECRTRPVCLGREDHRAGQTAPDTGGRRRVGRDSGAGERGGGLVV